MATLCDYLYRRGAAYWWQRRVPAALGIADARRISRPLCTTDPVLARRRARACSAAFDHVIMQFMTQTAPTRDELVSVLDDIFRRILTDGERTRAGRETGPPPWTPEPQHDPRYEGVDPEDWAAVSYPPEQWTEEWRDAVVTNRVDDVRPLLADALASRDLEPSWETAEWKRISRLSLIVAARAHAINARREWGDYSDGWPQSSDIPTAELPGAVARPSEAESATETAASAPATVLSLRHPTMSESFAGFLAMRSNWPGKYRKQAEGAAQRFISLMDDMPVNRITGATAEQFRERLRRVPALNGIGVYAGMSASQAIAAADRIADALKAAGNTVQVGRNTLSRAQAVKLTQRLAMKTVNRDLTIFTSWGKWMEADERRSESLHKGKCPFAGKRFKNSAARKESRLAGRVRIAFSINQLTTMLGAKPFATPPSMEPGLGPETDLDQAKFWSVLIALHTGVRLGEVAMLRPGDFKLLDGVHIIDIVSDERRSFKSEAGDRPIPLHPNLISLGLFDFATHPARSGREQLLPAVKYSEASDQRGANISKWFGRWRTALGIGGPQTPFHAFRKTFETGLKAKFRGRDTLVDQIVGHEPSSVGAAHYSDPLPIREKAQAVALIDYGIDLTQLLGALGCA